MMVRGGVWEEGGEGRVIIDSRSVDLLKEDAFEEVDARFVLLSLTLCPCNIAGLPVATPR